MSLTELFVIAVGLSMDAFAVAVCKGLSMRKMSWKKGVIVALYFGIFQGAMPLIGYFLGVQFQGSIQAVDHWIAFVLLGLIGANMIRESLSKEEEKTDDSVSFKSMSVLAVATSIDALAIGVTFAFLQVDIIPAVSFIGVTTFVLSLIGVKIGNVFGSRYKSKAEFIGGLILILMGLKILLEHLNIISF
ncbi:MAG TPA: manganese efflux pump MntP family protein [Firmicutes bacterium]|nr:manganese efflux pump MntP family protein [Bacillota bacterium]